MKTVICNSRGQHVLCETCGAAKPHYSASCEPCPIFTDAECEVMVFPIHVIMDTGEYLKLIDIQNYIVVSYDKFKCTAKYGIDKELVAKAYDFGDLIPKETFDENFNNAIRILQNKMNP